MVPMTWSGRSAFTASRNLAPALMGAEKKRGLSLISLLAEEVFHPVALLVEFLERRVHALAAELADLDAFHHLVAATAAGHRIAVDHTFRDAIAAVRSNPHRHPVA